MTAASTVPTPGAINGSLTPSITVKDIHKSLQWYQHVVGFAVENKIERDGKLVMASIRTGDVKLNLNQDDGAKGWERIKGLGCSYSLWTNDDVDAIARRIKANGGTLDSEPIDAPWGARYFRLTDPDGFHWAILKPIAPAK
jgi:uncharacterized glyoxalase superfamily protein PhnB